MTADTTPDREARAAWKAPRIVALDAPLSTEGGAVCAQCETFHVSDGTNASQYGSVS